MDLAHRSIRGVAYLTLALLTAATLARPAGAHAHAAVVISPEDRALAQEVYANARKLYEAKQYQQAVAALQKAYVCAPLPRILLSLGLAYLKLGNRSAARTALANYLRDQPHAPYRGQVEQLLADLKGGRRRPAHAMGARGGVAIATPVEPFEDEIPGTPAIPGPTVQAASAAPITSAASLAAAPVPAAAPGPPAGGSQATPRAARPTPLSSSLTAAVTWQAPTAGPSGELAKPDPQKLDLQAHAVDADAPTARFGIAKWSLAGASTVGIIVGALMLTHSSEQGDTLIQAAAPNGAAPHQAFDSQLRAIYDGYQTSRTWGAVLVSAGTAAAIGSITLFVLDAVAARDAAKPRRTRIGASAGAGTTLIVGETRF